MGFFKWFQFSNFMDTYQEWHAFVEGFSETFCFWKARYDPSPELLEDLRAEHHYYVFGRVVGFIALILTCLGIVRVIKGRKPSYRKLKEVRMCAQEVDKSDMELEQICKEVDGLRAQNANLRKRIAELEKHIAESHGFVCKDTTSPSRG